MFQFLKEIYFTAFTIFFRFRSRAWSPESNTGKSVGVITLIEWLFLLGIVWWLEMLVGTRFLSQFPKWIVAIAFLALFAANYYLLAIRDLGTAFEREFTHFGKSKKILLITSCITIIVVVIVFFMCSISIYHHFFHIIPKS
jgi:uncharacterized membrane protein YqhA